MAVISPIMASMTSSSRASASMSPCRSDSSKRSIYKTFSPRRVLLGLRVRANLLSTLTVTVQTASTSAGLWLLPRASLEASRPGSSNSRSTRPVDQGPLLADERADQQRRGQTPRRRESRRLRETFIGWTVYGWSAEPLAPQVAPAWHPSCAAVTTASTKYRGNPAYLASPATRLMVVAMITVPNR